MKLIEIYKIADKLAPVRLSREYCESYGAYDNSGILVDTGDEIKGIVFSLDLTFAAIEKAIESGANLMIVHHPAIYGKISEVSVEDPLGKKLVKCIKNGISVIAMHLNLDSAKEGIDENLQKGVCLAAGGENAEKESVCHSLSEGGYGRVYDIKPCLLKDLTAGLEKEFSTKRLLCYGDQKRVIKRVASFCGAGADEETVSFALHNEGGRADAILSSDFKHRLILRAIEEGLAVVVLTHYASENYGFKKYYEKIRQQVKIPCVYHTDEYLL